MRLEHIKIYGVNKYENLIKENFCKNSTKNTNKYLTNDFWFGIIEENKSLEMMS